MSVRTKIRESHLGIRPDEKARAKMRESSAIRWSRTRPTHSQLIALQDDKGTKDPANRNSRLAYFVNSNPDSSNICPEVLFECNSFYFRGLQFVPLDTFFE